MTYQSARTPQGIVKTISPSSMDATSHDVSAVVMLNSESGATSLSISGSSQVNVTPVALTLSVPTTGAKRKHKIS